MPELAPQELVDRVRKVREAMAQRGLDALVVYADMRALGGGNSFYLSNYHSSLEFPTLVVVPSKGELCLITHPGFQGASHKQALRESWVKDVRGAAYKMWGVDYARHVREFLEERKLAQGKMGIAGAELMSHSLYQRFSEELPHAKLEAAPGLVEGVRYVKSPGEMPLIREACRLTDIGLEAFMEASQPGVRQAEAIARADCKARLSGADATNAPMSGGKPWEWGFFRGDTVYQCGDMVAMELNAIYKGYFGQVCRTWVLGKATDEQKKVYETTFEASERMSEMVKPGVSGEELFQIGMKVIGGAGYEWCQVRFGHGMGLTMAEGVDFVPGAKMVLQEGCYVTVHPMVFQPDTPETGIGAIVGDSFLVTKTGAERLTKARQK